jgi:hypothetical protein
MDIYLLSGGVYRNRGSATSESDHWRDLFQVLAKKIGKQKTITVIARKMLVVVWHVMTKRERDR